MRPGDGVSLAGGDWHLTCADDSPVTVENRYSGPGPDPSAGPSKYRAATVLPLTLLRAPGGGVALANLGDEPVTVGLAVAAAGGGWPAAPVRPVAGGGVLGPGERLPVRW
jgi:hypothetical protein